MPKLILKADKPFDGEYPMDLSISGFSMREWAVMAAICSGMGSPARGHQILGYFYEYDGAAIVAVTTVMLQRAGKAVDPDSLVDLKGDAWTFDYTDLEPEDDGGPPDQSPSKNDELGEKSDEPESSG